MPKKMGVDSNLEDAAETTTRLAKELPQGADNASKRIAREWDRVGKMKMLKRQNVVTGTGLRNMKVSKKGEGRYSVVGPTYLMVLDVGCSPGTYPDTNNPRFMAAARSYGMTRQQLAESIAEKGTQAYPWIDDANNRARRLTPKIVKTAMRKSAIESKTFT